jgi:DNA replication protein DnaC
MYRDRNAPPGSLQLNAEWGSDSIKVNRRPTEDDMTNEKLCRRLAIPPLYYAALPLKWEPGFLTGPVGAGKTYRAIQRLKWAVAHSDCFSSNKPVWNPNDNDPPGSNHSPADFVVDAKFISLPALVSRLRGAYNDKEETLNEVREDAMHRNVVVLDDVGAFKTTDFVREELFNVIDHRLTHGLPTLLTSNLSIDQIRQTIDERVASRVLAFGPIRELKEGDHRLAQAVVESEGE